MKNKTKIKAKKQNVAVSDRVASYLFAEIVDVLIKKYEKSDERFNMDFMTYCIRLRDLSIEKVGKSTKNLKEGEKKNDCSSSGDN